MKNISYSCIYFTAMLLEKKYYYKGIDGSAHKPALLQDTDHMVKKTYHIAPYLGVFGAYLMPQWPIYGSKGVSK